MYRNDNVGTRRRRLPVSNYAMLLSGEGRPEGGETKRVTWVLGGQTVPSEDRHEEQYASPSVNVE